MSRRKNWVTEYHRGFHDGVVVGGTWIDDHEGVVMCRWGYDGYRATVAIDGGAGAMWLGDVYRIGYAGGQQTRREYLAKARQKALDTAAPDA